MQKRALLRANIPLHCLESNTGEREAIPERERPYPSEKKRTERAPSGRKKLPLTPPHNRQRDERFTFPYTRALHKLYRVQPRQNNAISERYRPIFDQEKGETR